MELNRVSFNEAPAKYDIRTWSPDHTKNETQENTPVEIELHPKS